ncbi:class I SAM-dependent methyltransferase [Propionibacteriaceae bacterium Y1685]
MATSGNWASGGAGWVVHEAIFDRVFAPLTAAILDSADLAAAQSMLDVGCGSGTLLAAAVERGVRATGVDISATMAEAARRRVPQSTVLLADAESADLSFGGAGPYERVLSRFGVMFFADPVAAFANLRSATASGGRLAFGCWRSLAENPSFTEGTSLLTAQLPDPPIQLDPAAPSSTSPHFTAPGPMAFAAPDRLRTVLTDAGWREVVITPFDFTLDYGEGAAAVEDRIAIILATSTGARAERILRPALGDRGWAELVDRVREHVTAQLTYGRVQLPAATWLVTATS